MRDRANEPRIRINDGITVPQVRLIDEKGEQLGIKPIRFAQDYAAEKGLDLVEVAAQADPPVCRVMNYSKYKLRARAQGQAGAQAPEPDRDQGDQVPAQGRRARLRDQEGPRGALPAAQGQGQGHDHVPRPRDGPSGARRAAAPAPGRRCQGVRRHRVHAAAGRAQHGHDAGAGEVAGGGAVCRR